MKFKLPLALLVLAGGCATAAVDNGKFERVVPETSECEYENAAGVQAWKCGDHGLFASDHEDAEHKDVVAHWIREVNSEAGFALRASVTDFPALRHEGKKYPASVARLKAGDTPVASILVVTSTRGTGQRGWACMGSAKTPDSELMPWCGKMIKGMVLAQNR